MQHERTSADYKNFGRSMSKILSGAPKPALTRERGSI